MKASDIVQAIRRKHSDSALVTELTLDDEHAWQMELRAMPAWQQQYYQHLIDPDFVQDPLVEPGGKRTRRIDCLLLSASKWTAVEIKVSRSDFKRDSYTKRRVWMQHCHRFVYATPVGLLTADEIPDGCGWWEVHPDGRVTVGKRAKVNKNRLPFPERFTETLMWRLFFK